MGQRRWPSLAEQPPLLLVPVGSLEQHGPHLPLATDSMVAGAVTRTAAEQLHARGRRVLVAPVLLYGASGEHEDFPGTVSIGHEALRLLVVELARSACRWAEGVIFVNGHGGNVPTLADAVRQLRCEGRSVAWTGCVPTGSDAHAGRTETSLLLHLAPWAVRGDLAEPGCTDPVRDLLPRLREEGVRRVSANGVLGDPSGASAAEGRRLFEQMVGTLVGELTDVDVDHDGRLTWARPAAVRA
ncbi:mycofactocin biosynthesis peptidyl-dipeptidase MftE [Nocardioides iriomotensis]|uniref:Mycofactocin biosynthesis peptidyl-dipeptidase MftE n=1 Tax=Nocardioides iriomotensis TaxID=715784 RepID=A0A4V1Z285_9ACTN|nr:mycofactocin biosynthesis peptidyl-dipeptidase MftE [Nocardioides iriomotensis]